MKLLKKLWNNFLGLFKKAEKAPRKPVKVLDPVELEPGSPKKPTDLSNRGSEPTGAPKYKRKPQPTKLNHNK